MHVSKQIIRDGSRVLWMTNGLHLLKRTKKIILRRFVHFRSNTMSGSTTITSAWVRPARCKQGILFWLRSHPKSIRNNVMQWAVQEERIAIVYGIVRSIGLGTTRYLSSLPAFSQTRAIHSCRRDFFSHKSQIHWAVWMILTRWFPMPHQDWNPYSISVPGRIPAFSINRFVSIMLENIQKR